MLHSVSRSVLIPTAVRLAAGGEGVILVGRRREKLVKVAWLIEQVGGRAHVFPADVTNGEEVHKLRDQVVDQTGWSVQLHS
ncbi:MULTISPECIES: SDR family NAD(P)-dependent oxidoreductase [Paenibacillaceae]|uniref:SDR family NAD(P)-dependent oxidoreductase n=1 Tax=unclassified Paenibacillus TaxID=185978 RepID=UPI0016425C39|nr:MULTISPECIES: SDR family NAD(P)-dependent oxidoreductase [Paenibacillaceae]MBU5445610.1 SDR family NAD(P)-dependent oxidoreductase [Paenibacillus sp. MSJ-34]